MALSMYISRIFYLLIKGKMISKQIGWMRAALKSAKSAPYSTVGFLKVDLGDP